MLFIKSDGMKWRNLFLLKWELPLNFRRKCKQQLVPAISNQYLALGLFNGLAIVALAIIFDRITQRYGTRIQKHRGQKK